MMNKINLQLSDKDSAHSFYLLMDEISLQTTKPVVEWMFEANFAEERPDMLNLIICSPGGDLNAAFALIDTMRGSAIPVRTTLNDADHAIEVSVRIRSLQPEQNYAEAGERPVAECQLSKILVLRASSSS